MNHQASESDVIGKSTTSDVLDRGSERIGFLSLIDQLARDPEGCGGEYMGVPERPSIVGDLDGIVHVNQKWHLSIYLFIYLSTCLSIYLSIYLSICLSIYLSIYLSI